MELTSPTTSGADTLVLTLSEDAWQGDARFTVAVDGQQIGGEFTAASLHGQGTDSLTLQGDWGAGQHTLTVTFLNDAYGGTADTDRNLYVEGVTVNGKAVAGGSAALYSDGSADLGFDVAAPETGATAPVSGTPVSGGDDHTGGVPGSWQEVWHESFDAGAGLFSRYWGPGVDFSTPGQVTIHTTADDQDSGMMVPPTGPDAGYGYGLYSFTLKTEGHIGVYALTWPASETWPGPELDLIEIHDNGVPYSTIHWKEEDGTAAGANGWQSFDMPSIDPSQTHTYSMLWEHGRITMYVDGQQQWTTTDHVPLDYAHGGENTCPGIGVQTWWNDGAMDGNNSITLYDASYHTIA